VDFQPAAACLAIEMQGLPSGAGRAEGSSCLAARRSGRIDKHVPETFPDQRGIVNVRSQHGTDGPRTIEDVNDKEGSRLSKD
jgi:hypothetical protein